LEIHISVLWAKISQFQGSSFRIIVPNATPSFSISLSGFEIKLNEGFLVSEYQFPNTTVQFPNTTFQFPNATKSFRIPVSEYHLQFLNAARQFPNTTVTAFQLLGLQAASDILAQCLLAA